MLIVEWSQTFPVGKSIWWYTGQCHPALSGLPLCPVWKKTTPCTHTSVIMHIKAYKSKLFSNMSRQQDNKCFHLKIESYSCQLIPLFWPVLMVWVDVSVKDREEGEQTFRWIINTLNSIEQYFWDIFPLILLCCINWNLTDGVLTHPFRQMVFWPTLSDRWCFDLPFLGVRLDLCIVLNFGLCPTCSQCGHTAILKCKRDHLTGFTDW